MSLAEIRMPMKVAGYFLMIFLNSRHLELAFTIAGWHDSTGAIPLGTVPLPEWLNG